MKNININVHEQDLTKLPKNLPQEIDGYFDCLHNELTTLKNSPACGKQF
jgi:hypothetical protein